jgi:hypothetical protein
MTEAEAWREIARRIVEGEWNHQGLCSEAWRLFFGGLITPSVSAMMRVRMRHYVGNNQWWAYRQGTNREARALAALWMALEAEEGAA